MAPPKGFSNALSMFIEKYVNKVEIDLSKKKYPILDFIPMDSKGAEGSGYEEPFIMDGMSTAGSSREQAQAMEDEYGGTLKGARWSVGWAPIYGGARINHVDLVKANASSDRTVLIDYLKGQINGGMDDMFRILAQWVWGPTYNYLIAATIHASSGLVTVATANRPMLSKLRLNQRIQATADNTSSSTLLGAGNSGYIIAISEEAGTFTVSKTSGGTAGTPDGWSTAAYFHRYGVFAAGANPTTIIHSIQEFIPTSTPSDTFCGVDRSTHPILASGVRLPSAIVSSLSIKERMERLIVEQQQFGGTPIGVQKFFMSPYQLYNLYRALRGEGVPNIDKRDLDSRTGEVEFMFPTGAVRCVSDPYCPTGYTYLLDKGAMSLKHFGKFPQSVNQDGQELRVLPNADDLEKRLFGLVGFIVRKPSSCGVVALPATTY